MFARNLTSPKNKSFFLFGPRGTGKSTWVRQRFPDCLLIDLLDARDFTDFLAQPTRLAERIPAGHRGWVAIDEIQKVPSLLDEVHRLIETRGLCFVLTGSSARKLRRGGVNLLAGRALTYEMHPLVVGELGEAFDLEFALNFGFLPAAWTEQDPKRYLESYVRTYLQEEVLQEGITQNLPAFTRFLEAASFSQAQPVSYAAVARDCAIERRTVQNYFEVLEQLLIASRIPVFTKRAQRRMTSRPKFMFFDVGVFRTLRPSGPLDRPEEIAGPALETLVWQQLRAINSYEHLGYGFFFWRSADHVEVDLVMYGNRGLLAIEVKRSAAIRSRDLRGLKAFGKDYPQARKLLIYGGQHRETRDTIDLVPLTEFLLDTRDWL